MAGRPEKENEVFKYQCPAKKEVRWAGACSDRIYARDERSRPAGIQSGNLPVVSGSLTNCLLAFSVQHWKRWRKVWMREWQPLYNDPQIVYCDSCFLRPIKWAGTYRERHAKPIIAEELFEEAHAVIKRQKTAHDKQNAGKNSPLRWSYDGSGNRRVQCSGKIDFWQ